VGDWPERIIGRAIKSKMEVMRMDSIFLIKLFSLIWFCEMNECI